MSYVALALAQESGPVQQSSQKKNEKPNPEAGHKMPGMQEEQKKPDPPKEIDHSKMPGMDHPKMPGMDHMMDMNQAGTFLMGQASGTSMNPQSWPMPMLMTKFGSWHTMFMANGFIVDTQQSGSRGHDKFYAPNWFMASAEHSVGRGSFMFQFMGSLDPATATQRRYPELFQTGETAFGKPIVDGQHPHDLIMGSGFHYACPIAVRTIL